MQSPVRCNARSNAEPAPACRTPVHRGSRGIPIRHIAEFQSAARKLIEVYSSQHDLFEAIEATRLPAITPGPCTRAPAGRRPLVAVVSSVVG